MCKDESVRRHEPADPSDTDPKTLACDGVFRSALGLMSRNVQDQPTSQVTDDILAWAWAWPGRPGGREYMDAAADPG